MKIKLDENIPDQLKEVLAEFGHDVDTVKDEDLAGRKDPEVWTAAQKASRFVITHDLYFTDVRQHAPGSHAGVLLLRLPAADRDQVLERMRQVFKDTDVESWKGCNVVVTNKMVRVRRM